MATFTKADVASQLADTLADCDYGDFEDFDEVFQQAYNAQPYIIGTYKAAQELAGYASMGVFSAIDAVTSYEKTQFGEVSTDIADPESLATMLMYVLGDEFWTDTLDKLDIDSDDYTQENFDKIKKYLSDTEFDDTTSMHSQWMEND